MQCEKAGCEDTLAPPVHATTPAAHKYDSALAGLSTRANTLGTSGCKHSIARVAALQAGAKPKLTRSIETPEEEMVQQLALVGNPRRMEAASRCGRSSGGPRADSHGGL